MQVIQRAVTGGKTMICLGAGNFGTKTSKEEAFRIMDRYLELGGVMIDTANVYARWGVEKENLSEQYIGQWLADRRVKEKMKVATKGGHYDLETPDVSRIRRDCIRKDLEESLRCLGLERIELYWVHKDDRSVSVEEIVDWMEELVKEGLIVNYGASNMKLDRAEQARQYAREKGLNGFCAMQNRFTLPVVNPGHKIWQDPGTVIPDADYRKWHAEHQVPLYAYSSLSQGFYAKWSEGSLTEPLKEMYLNEETERIGRVLTKESKETGLSYAALTLRELMKQSFPVIPVAAVSRAEQLDELESVIP